jgi:hypothetical protein
MYSHWFCIGVLRAVGCTANGFVLACCVLLDVQPMVVLIFETEIWGLYEDEGWRINLTEMDGLRRSARTSKLDRKTNAYIREKMDPKDTILGDNPKTTNLVRSCR